MSRLLRIPPIALRQAVALRAYAQGSQTNQGNEVTRAPEPGQVAKKDLKFDKLTHTGQAWDEADYRLARFAQSQKQVNPNIAMDLVAKKPPIDCGHERIAVCDGGHPGLGHPKIYINLDKPGTHACGYCGNRFYNSDVTKGKDLEVHHLST